LVRADTDGDGLLSLHEMTAEQRETLHALAGTMAHVDGETSCSVAQRR
jgi:hypothetical protein